MSEKKPPSPAMANIFANALASTPRYEGASAAAGMHNTLECGHCGAARERDSDAMICRYCGHALSHASAAAAKKAPK